MRRLLARVALFLLAAGAVFGAWLVRISVTSGLWPFFSTHHPRLLSFVGGLLAWAAAVIAVLVVVVFVIWLLWVEAFR